jgi:AAA family ATP:ADP antiporter
VIRRIIKSFFDVRKGEVLLTFLMLAYYYLVLVTYYLLKPARDSLFLVKLGAHQLPLVFILTALVIAPITTLYSRASNSLKLNRLIYITSAVLVVNLIVLRWLLDIGAPWVFYVFYVWVSIYGAMTASQYWLFANAVYDPAQGKRLFALLNIGGILGAMTGGEVTSLIVRTFGVATEDLLFLCMALIAGFTVVAGLAWRVVIKDRREGRTVKKSSVKEQSRDSMLDMFSQIKRSRHLLYLVGIIALTMATASFVDYQFKTVSVQSFPAKEDLTAFLGTFYGRLSMVSLILQVAFTYRILGTLGVTGIVMFLPLGLLFGSIAMFIFPGLIAAIVLRGADGSLKYSFDKTGRELLFLPIPLEVKKRTKVFIDMFVDRWFRGVAGGALLLFTVVFGFSVRQLSLVVIVMLAVWLTLVILIRKEYVNTFRLALKRREIDPSQLTANITDASTIRTLREALKSEKAREIVYALDLLKTADTTSLLEELAPLIGHPDGEVRIRVVQVLYGSASEALAPAVEPLVHDPDPETRLAAVRFLVERAGRDPVVLFNQRITDEPRIAATLLRYIGESGTVEQQDAVSWSSVERLVESVTGGDDGEEIRIEAAKAAGSFGVRDKSVAVEKLLYGLLKGYPGPVAEQVLLSMGKTRARVFVPTLIENLVDRRRRKYARDALVQYGDGVVGTLSDILGDDQSDINIRRYVPVILSRVPTQKSVNALTMNLNSVDTSIRFRIVKALNILQRRYPDLRFRVSAIDDAFIEETKIYYEILQIQSLHKKAAGSDADALLARALDERLLLNLERIFRLLGLNYPPQDIYSAYLGIVSMEKDRHASAIEFLDNVVGKNIKKYLFPIIDRISESIAIRRGQELFGVEIDSREAALVRLIEGPDAWLKACALFCVSKDDPENVKKAAKKAVYDPDPVVVETAKLITPRLA